MLQSPCKRGAFLFSAHHCPPWQSAQAQEVFVSRTRLSDLAVQKLASPDKGQRIIFDDTVRGFGVRLSQGGSKTWVIVHGKNRTVKALGRYPDKTLKDARKEAQALLAQSAPQNPATPIVDALGAFLEHSEAHNKPRTKKDYERLLNRHLPTGRLKDITRQGMLEKLARLSKTPAELSHAFVAIKVFLNWCVATGRLDSNPLSAVRSLGNVKKRERILSPDELKAVWKALEDDTFSTIIRLCILTGCRRGEIQHLTFRGDIATVPAEYSKNRREHNFPVGKLTASYLGKDLTFNGWGKCKARLDKASGVTGYTIHDIRRTFASLHAEIGTPVHVVEKLLNHVSGTFAGVSGTYNRYSYMTEMCEAVDKYEQFLKKLVL
jgi:integrase